MASLCGRIGRDRQFWICAGRSAIDRSPARLLTEHQQRRRRSTAAANHLLPPLQSPTCPSVRLSARPTDQLQRRARPARMSNIGPQLEYCKSSPLEAAAASAWVGSLLAAAASCQTDPRIAGRSLRGAKWPSSLALTGAAPGPATRTGGARMVGGAFYYQTREEKIGRVSISCKLSAGLIQIHQSIRLVRRPATCVSAAPLCVRCPFLF